jgi:cytochrome c oxidase subunit 4
MAEQRVPVRLYVAVFVALLALTALTVVAAYAELGALSVPVAVGIAVLKASLVVLYFMHLRYETRLVMLWAASGLVFLVILVAITVGEVMGRAPQPPDRLGPPASLDAAGE